MRENRPYGSEGGEVQKPSLPLSSLHETVRRSVRNYGRVVIYFRHLRLPQKRRDVLLDRAVAGPSGTLDLLRLRLAMTGWPSLLASHDRAGVQRAIRGSRPLVLAASSCDLRQPTGAPKHREACREVDGRKAFHFGFAGSIQRPAMASRAPTSSSK